MALPSDERDFTRLLNSLRHEIAQNRTDIQRLWRLVARETHEPFFVIGGDAEDSSAGGSDVEGPPFPPPDNTDPPGGGPDPSYALPQGCCLWIWNGQEWIKAVDDAAGCACPPPDQPGDAPFAQAVTCCEESSSSDDSSSETPCAVPCWTCELPCVLHYSTAARPGHDPVPECEDFAGSRACVWNPDVGAWESACFALPNHAFFESGRIRITPRVPAPNACVLTAAQILYYAAGCEGAFAAGGSVEVEIQSCDPVFGESLGGCFGKYAVTITE
jgi:hypothetical protein